LADGVVIQHCQFFAQHSTKRQYHLAVRDTLSMPREQVSLQIITKQGDTGALTVSFNLKKWTILGLVKAEQLGPPTAAN
jgi:hypothetical protein